MDRTDDPVRSTVPKIGNQEPITPSPPLLIYVFGPLNLVDRNIIFSRKNLSRCRTFNFFFLTKQSTCTRLIDFSLKLYLGQNPPSEHPERYQIWEVSIRTEERYCSQRWSYIYLIFQNFLWSCFSLRKQPQYIYIDTHLMVPSQGWVLKLVKENWKFEKKLKLST